MHKSYRNSLSSLFLDVFIVFSSVLALSAVATKGKGENDLLK